MTRILLQLGPVVRRTYSGVAAPVLTCWNGHFKQSEPSDQARTIGLIPGLSSVRTKSTAYSEGLKTNLVACHLQSRSLVRLKGSDVFAFLQGIITNDINHLEGKPAIYSLLLNHQGRVLYDVILYSTNSKEDVWIECDSNVKQVLLKHLTVFRIRKKVEITDGSDLQLKVWVAFQPVGSEPAGTASPLEHHTSKRETIHLSNSNTSSQAVEGIGDPRLTDLGWRVLVSESQETLFRNSGVVVEPEESYRRLRYFWGVGEGVQDLPTGNCFPLESNGDYLHGISFQKGCYIGQELTARTHHTGVVRKRLMPFRFATETGLTGEKFSEERIVGPDGKLVGKVRGISGSVGLALTRIEESAAAPTLTLGGHPVTVVKPSWWPYTAPKESQVGSRS